MATRKQQKLEKRGERVELLDDQKRFDEIDSNRTNVKYLKNKVKLDYVSWYNWFKQHPHPTIQISKQKDTMDWVGKHAQAMIKWLTDFYSGNVPQGRPGAGQQYKPNTLKIQLNSLSWVLLTIDKDKFGEMTRPMWVQSLKIAVEDEDQKEENEMTEDEKKNWICFADLETKRNDMIKLWMKDFKNTRLESTRKHHLYALILAFNTWRPPMRLDLLGMKFWYKNTEPPTSAKKGADAYLWQKSKGNWAIVINKDKVSGKFDRFGLPRAIYDISVEIPGVTDGVKLNKIINSSLEVWPNREFVLPATRNPTSAMKPTGYTSALRWMFKPKRPGQNIIRKAFVNEFYPKVNTKTQKLVADSMRHSVEVARRAYIKAGSALICAREDEDLEDQTVVIKTKAVLKEPKTVIEKIQPRTPAKITVKKEEYFDPVDYGKKYRATNQATLKAKRQAKYQDGDERQKLLRAKQVFALNAGYVKTVRKATLEKYDLKQEDDGTWY